MTKIDVTIDRDKFIGGSDIPIIMGISKFRTRYQLLLEKAGIEQSTFEGNKYTRYGDTLEPQIRDYINQIYFTEFEPSRAIAGDLRANTDGFNGKAVLEIKTTSHIYNTVDEYKHYLVQLLFYMDMHNVKDGLLAVYSRPEDFNPVFDPVNLSVYGVKADDYKELREQIKVEIDQFRADVQRLKDNPLLTEQDFVKNELVEVANKVVALEMKMQAFKELEKQYKEMRQKLYDAMLEADCKSWTMLNGTKITRVDGTPATAKVVEEFDIEAFKKEQADLYNLYMKEVVKQTSGRQGYAKITLPKD